MIATTKILTSLALIPIFFLQGCTSCEMMDSFKTVCVTQGKESTAYLSSAISAQQCPEGWRCISALDNSPENAADLRTCGVKPPTPTPVTNIRNSTPVNVGPAPRMPNQPIAISPAPTVSAPILAPAPKNCLQECSSRGSNCVKLNLTIAQASVASHLADVVLKGKATQIETPWVMREFQMRADPCQRSATSLKAGKVTNEGSVCVIRAPVNDLRAVAKIELPAIVEGNTSITAQSGLFSFTVPARRPSVTLVDPANQNRIHALNPKLGGAILKLEADTSRIFIRTHGGCIGATYSASALP